MKTGGIAVFLGGVRAESQLDHNLSFHCGRTIGRLGYTLFHGGYNGLMEDAARGASEEGAKIFAITLAHKEEWGNFNRYITRAFYFTDLGQRLNTFFSTANVVIAMGGGIGTLHEIAAAIWYSGNIRRIPVILLGDKAEKLLITLKEQGWIYESPTRPIDFLHVARSAEEFDILVGNLDLQPATQQEKEVKHLKQMILDASFVNGHYMRADGSALQAYFDPFRLNANPQLLHATATAISAQLTGDFDAVAGIELGGVTLATHIATVLNKPLLVVRPKPKAYGTYAQVEGNIISGWRALLIDDVVRGGTAILAARKALQSVNLDSIEAACILTYGPSGFSFLREQGVTLHSFIVQSDHKRNPTIDQYGGT